MPSETSTIRANFSDGFSIFNRKSQHNGFALVATLIMSILLLLLGMGLLSLSAVTLRTSGQGSAVAQAQANAKLALVEAIGQLQKQAGPDTRVTARADILDANNPPVLGVWKSWEGTDHETSGNFQGRPISPGNYASAKKARFLSWLVSSEDPASSDSSTVPDTTPGNGKVTLIGENTVGTTTSSQLSQIHLTPTLITNGTSDGAYAWWIGGENQKARLPKHYEPSEDNAARWSVQAQTHSVVDPAPFGLDNLLDNPSPADKTISLKQAALLEGTPSETGGSFEPDRQFFHDLSTTSVGLLTNTATGGWRKDLSILTERWEQQPSNGLPVFQVLPGQNLLSNRPSPSNPVPSNSLFYPWAEYNDPGHTNAFAQHGPVSSWASLSNYATLYKKISSTPPYRLPFAAASTTTEGNPLPPSNSYDYLHTTRVSPVIARIQWIFSHWAAPLTAPPGFYEARLVITPVVTMWNPYNVEIETDGMKVSLNCSLPPAFKYAVGEDFNANPSFYALYDNSHENNGSVQTRKDLGGRHNQALAYQLPKFILKPGETRVFSPEQTTPVLGKSTAPLINPPPFPPIPMKEGYRAGGGHYFRILNNAQEPWKAMGNAKLRVEVKYDTMTRFKDTDTARVMTYIDVYGPQSGLNVLAYRMGIDPDVAEALFPPENRDMYPTTLQQVTTPRPFLSAVFGARVASNSYLAAKGFAQSSPLVNFTDMGGGEAYDGVKHPVNGPFDYDFIPHAQAGDAFLPQTDSENHGFIISGYDWNDGLTRCVIAAMPLRPLASLGDLQHWNMRQDNPMPPFKLNIIGNSDASPLIRETTVVGNLNPNLDTNRQYDDSYCANHILFDDWFFSSVAPDPSTFGNDGKTTKETYRDFLTGDTPLSNRSYKAIKEDSASASSAANADSLFEEHVEPEDSWQTIASRFEVEGMFNVNSTSVKAWRALLGHAREQKVPVISKSGASWTTKLSPKYDYPFSRFNIAGDFEAKTQGESAEELDTAAEFAGFRAFTSDTLDLLAAEIVKQVQGRGPFLSLSEFVNRQLAAGNYSLAGAVQSALDAVSEASNDSPWSVLKEPVNSKVASETFPQSENSGYQFPAAANGYSSYGLPGWIRQADILRPIAPILSARDDTFTIRAYGDARDVSGKILAKASCEAVIQRTREYIDPADAADITTLPTQTANITYGRRFDIISFRWLSDKEI